MNVRVAGVCCALAVALSAAAASAATPPQPVPIDPGGPNMPATTATLSSTRAGARPVALTLKVHYEMVCGRPGQGKAVVALPRAVFVPAHIDRSGVLVDGGRSPSVAVSGHAVSIAMPVRRPGVTCMVVGPGTLTLTLTRAAGIGNPKTPGTYVIRVTQVPRSFAAKVVITE